MKIFKYIGFGLLSIFLFFIGIAVISSINQAKQSETFIPFIKQNMPEIAKWDKGVFENLLTDEAFNSITPDQWELYLNKVSSLGRLESVGELRLENTSSFTSFSGDTQSTAVYTVPMNFTTGQAHAKLVLIHTDELGVKIQHIKFLSDHLMQ
ncbi:hypothetical protein N473_08485 [Pseudoalteromonas luteoviolacea CPMOR-1]|uniref:DUF4019 domain-containing protein n=2 Tax=Pseudoalteromonas luteoviolacea TaxID=43657 RepID=A0A167MH94_9GAMM|nr:hypothetical protein N473_08485 [Pseudoalteromonas luteoviolacea CPMOR-1]